MKKVAYLDTSKLMKPHVHGVAGKDMAVLHETVSHDIVGWGDIKAVENFLASKDYGIHGMTDLEGHKAWAYGLGNAIFWQAGGVNTRSIGIEQVSLVMEQSHTNDQRFAIWMSRTKQLDATAQLLAAWHNVDPQHHPLRLSNGLTRGVTSHWNVSQHFAQSEGHTDCRPSHEGGYYPILHVITLARHYASLGYHF